MVKLIKRKKSSRFKGKNMGTAGSGARKNKRGSGNKGGKGMSGTGKRADHKKTLVQKKYGHKYFGKMGVTRGNNKRDIRKRINVGDLQSNLERFAEKKGTSYEVKIPKYKVLGKGEVKDKLNVTCLEISTSAKEKIESAGGSVKLVEKKVLETPFVQKPEKKKK